VWFWFGIFTSIKLAAFLGYLRFEASWAGEARRVRGRACEVRVGRSEGGAVIGVRVGVPCRTDYRFTVRRQSAFDDFFLKLGLVAEQTVQDVVFDDSVYLLSDDRRLGHLLRRDSKFRRALYALLYEYDDDVMRVGIVRCAHGRLWVDCRPATSASSLSEELATKRVIRSLLRAAKGLEGVPTPTAPSGTQHELGAPRPADEAPASVDPKLDAAHGPPHDRHATTAAVLLTASTALCVFGVLGLFAFGSALPIILDRRSFVTASMLVGIACTAALLGLCIALLRKTSRLHIVAMELLVSGTLGCLSSSFSVLYLLNLDTNGPEPTFVNVAASGARAYRSCKGASDTCYEVQLGSGENIEPRSLSINRTEYHQFRDASAARLTIYEGKLGFRWLARVEPILE
jgi:hypothetical protein